jgi:AcrR family transcriptional regulator
MLSTKERILDAAMHLLDTGGPSAVTLRAVGSAAGISQSAPYRHFEDKRALLEAMVRANLDQMNEALEKASRNATSPFGALEHAVRQYFDFARRFPVRYRFLFEVSREDTALGSEARQAFEALAALVRAAQQAGELREGDASQIASLIFGTVFGMADLAQFGFAGVSTRSEAVDDLALLLLDLLARKPTPQNA